MKIMICGLTGTGKSTIAKAISDALNYEYISSSKLFREFAGKNTTKGQDFWATKEGMDFLDNRLNEDVDELFDKMLLNKVDQQDDFVIDSWTLPWLYKDLALRIYLKCPFPIRVSRVMFRDKLEEKKAKEVVKKKDADTRKIYLQKYGFDITKDLTPFDLIVNTQYFNAKGIILYVLDYIKNVEKYYK